MSPTDRIPVDSFVSALLLPLRHLNARRGVRYLKLERDSESYWGPVISRTGGLEHLPAAECDGAGLLARLGTYWTARGETNLPKLVPHLLALRSKIMERRSPDDGKDFEVSDFVYPLF